MTAEPPARRRSLFDLGAELEALADLLAECGGDVTDPTACAAVEAWYAELHDGMAAKLDRLNGYLSQLGMEAAACRGEARTWAARASAKERAIDGTKAMALRFMALHGHSRLKSAAGLTFAVRANGGKSPVVVTDADRLGDKFLRVTVEPDADAIRAALEAGEAVPGAALGERGSHLRIN